MSYSTDISNLNASHHWKFDGDSTDSIGSANGTDSSVIYTDSAIAEDATYCMTTNAATDDRVSIPTTTDINNSAQSRKIVAGWFQVTAIQPPPKRIYGEGNNSICFQFIFAYGNNSMFECVDDSNFTLQVFGPPLQPNRTYHLCGVFEGSGYDNDIKFYVDGKKQSLSEPEDPQPDATTLSARGVAEFGDPAGTVGIGGDVILLNAPVNGKYQHWATWSGISLTDTEIRETLFEKGALPDVTISSNTETNMQTSINAYSGTTRDDAPLCIRIEDCTDGDFTIELNNIKFDEKASIHIQYTGNDTLTIVNKNGSNCSIVSTTNGGTIIIKNNVEINILVKDASDYTVIKDARVYIEADSGGDITAGTQIINTLTDSQGKVSFIFGYTSDQPIIGRVRKGTTEVYYKEGVIPGPITSDGLNKTILLVKDQ